VREGLRLCDGGFFAVSRQPLIISQPRKVVTEDVGDLILNQGQLAPATVCIMLSVRLSCQGCEWESSTLQPMQMLYGTQTCFGGGAWKTPKCA
jgi:hypothetical protein